MSALGMGQLVSLSSLCAGRLGQVPWWEKEERQAIKEARGPASPPGLSRRDRSYFRRVVNQPPPAREMGTVT